MSDNTFLRALLSVGSGSIVYNVSRIIVIILVARPLDVNDLGKYFIIVAISGVIFSVASFGTNVTIVKSLAEEDDVQNKKKILFTAINFYFISLLFCILLGLFINLALGLEKLEFVHFFFIVSAALFQYLSYALQGIKKYKELSISYVISGVLYISLSFLFVVTLDYGIDGLFSSVALANLIPAFFQYLVLTKKTSIGDILYLDKSELNLLIKFSFPLYINQLYTNLYDRGYTLLLAFLLNPSAVAYYSIATRIPVAIEEVRKVYLSVFYPTIVSTIRENKETAMRFISASVHFFLVTMLLVAAVFLITKTELTILVFGEKYKIVSMAIFLLIARSAFTFCGPILGMSIIALGHNKVPLSINFFVTTATFSASYFLIPNYGYMAVVYIAVLGSAVGFFMNYMYLKFKYNNLNLRYILLNILLFISYSYSYVNSHMIESILLSLILLGTSLFIIKRQVPCLKELMGVR